jgi:hypothetical protein
MPVSARSPRAGEFTDDECSACGGAKKAPIAADVDLSYHSNGGSNHVSFLLCEECGRDVANAVGFMCVRDGGWSKLEPRKRKAAR